MQLLKTLNTNNRVDVDILEALVFFIFLSGKKWKSICPYPIQCVLIHAKALGDMHEDTVGKPNRMLKGKMLENRYTAFLLQCVNQ